MSGKGAKGLAGKGAKGLHGVDKSKAGDKKKPTSRSACSRCGGRQRAAKINLHAPRLTNDESDLFIYSQSSLPHTSTHLFTLEYRYHIALVVDDKTNVDHIFARPHTGLQRR